MFWAAHWQQSFSFVIPFFCNCLSNVLFEHQSFIDFADILIYFVYFFTVGLVEEVLFRGYLQTRLHSLLKHILLDVLVTGVVVKKLRDEFEFYGDLYNGIHLIP